MIKIFSTIILFVILVLITTFTPSDDCYAFRNKISEYPLTLLNDGNRGELSPITSIAVGGSAGEPETILTAEGAATKGALKINPDGAVNGIVFTIQPVVQLQDADGNNVKVVGVIIIASLVSETGVLSGTTAIATNSNGVALFTDLIIHGEAGNFILNFTPKGKAQLESIVFKLAAGSATKVVTETAADGSGTAVENLPVTEGSRLKLYAITRDESDNFIANVSQDDWSLENLAGGDADGELILSDDTKSAVFIAHISGTLTTPIIHLF